MRRVDWNILPLSYRVAKAVTPRMRRVDWNRRIKRLVRLRYLVTPRMRRVDWNIVSELNEAFGLESRLAWGVWIEIFKSGKQRFLRAVTPRMRRVDWNCSDSLDWYLQKVTPRMRRVDWNHNCIPFFNRINAVTPRMRRVDWNLFSSLFPALKFRSRLAWGVWIEILSEHISVSSSHVTPRMRRVDWNR